MPHPRRLVAALRRALRRALRAILGPLRALRPARAGAPPTRAAQARGGGDAERLGRRGERAAVACLKAEGYHVLARRFRPSPARTRRAGEVDVLALDGETVVLVEVKATLGDPRTALDRVDRRKRRRLRGAWAALARRPRFAAHPRRLDVVAVGLGGRRPVCVLHRGFAPLSR